MAAHETFERAGALRASSDRTFGLVIGGIAAGVGLWWVSIGRSWAAPLVAAGAVLMVAGALRPRVLGPLNRAWMKLGLLLSKVVGPVAMGVLYFGVVTPFGFVRRVLSRDPLGLRIDRAAASYWVGRPSERDAGFMRRPF